MQPHCAFGTYKGKPPAPRNLQRLPQSPPCVWLVTQTSATVLDAFKRMKRQGVAAAAGSITHTTGNAFRSSLGSSLHPAESRGTAAIRRSHGEPPPTRTHIAQRAHSHWARVTTSLQGARGGGLWEGACATLWEGA